MSVELEKSVFGHVTEFFILVSYLLTINKNSTRVSSPTTRTQIYRGIAGQQKRAELLFERGCVILSDKKKQIYLVTNERNDVHMVKYTTNKCTCYAQKNCAHFLACMLFNKIDIYSNYIEKKSALSKSLTKLRMNQKGNKLAGRKYRDNIPQLDPQLVCDICKKEERKGHPGQLCCSKFVHNKCKKNHRCC